MNLVWATRGRTWGFRFLLDGGYADPLPVYERAFAGVEGERTVCRRVGTLVALRFSDPEGRHDESGRRIPHDIVVLPPLADVVHSAEDGRRLVWPMLAEAFERLWEQPRAPSREDVESALQSSPDSAVGPGS
ncbi:hypothetical protein [Cellulomonas sp. Root137]|uniref:hypothetical protein n=1 Tax=Cellulomonas sp. Root137 TaxID=1736459 RepID=UPI0006F77604|nr:hypothetical protein [Cellulomonas sp. Root137]KQY41858.1 hypothetical protein ASD18_19660 [Cellulomonas sp. Root137]